MQDQNYSLSIIPFHHMVGQTEAGRSQYRILNIWRTLSGTGTLTELAIDKTVRRVLLLYCWGRWVEGTAKCAEEEPGDGWMINFQIRGRHLVQSRETSSFNHHRDHEEARVIQISHTPTTPTPNGFRSRFATLNILRHTPHGRFSDFLRLYVSLLMSVSPPLGNRL